MNNPTTDELNESSRIERAGHLIKMDRTAVFTIHETIKTKVFTGYSDTLEPIMNAWFEDNYVNVLNLSTTSVAAHEEEPYITVVLLYKVKPAPTEDEFGNPLNQENQ